MILLRSRLDSIRIGNTGHRVGDSVLLGEQMCTRDLRGVRGEKGVAAFRNLLSGQTVLLRERAGFRTALAAQLKRRGISQKVLPVADLLAQNRVGAIEWAIRAMMR